MKLKFGRYDRAAWAVLATYAGVSLSVPVILVQMAEDLRFPLPDGGMSIGGSFQLARSVSMTTTLALSGFAAARWGNRRSMGWSTAVMGAGILLASLAGSWVSIIPLLVLAGLGEGVIEGLATPFVQDLHDKEPSRYVSFTHGFWSVGTFFFALSAGVMLTCGLSWRWVLAFVGASALAAALGVLAPSRTPYPEKTLGRPAGAVASASSAIMRQRAFWLFFASMVFAGGGEYCLTFWSASFIQLNFGSSALAGAAGTAVFSTGMITGRSLICPRVPQRHLKALVLAAAALGAAVTAFVPVYATHAAGIAPVARIALFFALLYFAGIGSAPFWPTIQSLAVDCIPAFDSTAMFILLSCAGVPGAGLFTWLVGVVGDAFGLAASFCLIPACYAAMAVLVIAAARSARTCNK